MLTEAVLRSLWPRGDSRVPGLVAGIAEAAPVIFPKYGLTTDLTVAHAMAQFSHECGAGTEMVENVGYTAERAAQVWPLRGPDDRYAYRHFASAADCYTKCGSSAGDPDFRRKLINLVYGDRNGNRAGTDDGYTFIGRGLSQVTGRGNYASLGSRTGLDLVGIPFLACDPVHALECGVADFVMCGCLPYAVRDDVVGVTEKLNGGTVGLSERKVWLARWKQALSRSPQEAPIPASVGTAPAGGAAAGAVVIAAGSAHSAGLPLPVVIAAGAAAAAVAFYLVHRSTSKGA